MHLLLQRKEHGVLKKIATNTPESFGDNADYQFTSLGKDMKGVSMIVLMLEKNFGEAHVKELEALTFYLSCYPVDVPAHLIGCETLIPDENVQKYKSQKRDNAIKELCDAVLKRSKRILVRGRPTFLHLTELLGYEPHQIDVIFDNGEENLASKVLNFLEDNNIPLVSFQQNIAEFQWKPNVINKTVKPVDIIKIGKPYITSNEIAARLNADITIGDEIKTIWCETNERNKSYFLYERADAFVCVMLPYALRHQVKEIRSDAPVTEQFLHNLNEILIPHLCKHDETLYPTKIIGTSDPGFLRRGDAVATGMSCGVDSFFSLVEYFNPAYASLRLTHLYVGNYSYGNDNLIYERGRKVANNLGLEIVTTGTNINADVEMPHQPTHFFKTMFGVLSLRKLFRTYVYGSTYDFGNFNLKNNSKRDTAAYELLLLYVFSNPEFQLMTGGASKSRLEKLLGIASFPLAQQYLNVCLNPHNTINCSKCTKCSLILSKMEMCGVLDNFRSCFDVDEWLSLRLDAMVHLARSQDHPEVREVYAHFKNTEPELIKRANEIVFSAVKK